MNKFNSGQLTLNADRIGDKFVIKKLTNLRDIQTRCALYLHLPYGTFDTLSSEHTLQLSKRLRLIDNLIGEDREMLKDAEFNGDNDNG